jgi:predicted membrane chloride channel (bestrophin family)
MAEEKELPIQQIAAQAEDNVEDITDEAKKKKKQITSVADTTGAGSTLLG